MKILGLDPANKCGWSLSSGEHGCWLLSRPDEHCGRRMERLRRCIYKLHKDHRIELIAAENATMGSHVFHTQNSHSELRGIIKLVAAELELPLMLVNPMTLKKWLTGHGRAKKEDMIDAVRRRFSVITTDDNVADAIAVMEYARDNFAKNKEMQDGCASKKTKRKIKRRT